MSVQIARSIRIASRSGVPPELHFESGQGFEGIRSVGMRDGADKQDAERGVEVVRNRGWGLPGKHSTGFGDSTDWKVAWLEGGCHAGMRVGKDPRMK